MTELNENLLTEAKALSQERPENSLNKYYVRRVKLIRYTKILYLLTLARGTLQLLYLGLWLLLTKISDQRVILCILSGILWLGFLPCLRSIPIAIENFRKYVQPLLVLYLVLWVRLLILLLVSGSLGSEFSNDGQNSSLSSFFLKKVALFGLFEGVILIVCVPLLILVYRNAWICEYLQKIVKNCQNYQPSPVQKRIKNLC